MDYTVRYEQNGEWCGYTISSSKVGWRVDYWSSIEGEVTGRIIMAPFSEPWETGTCLFPKDIDLDGPYNDLTDNGQALAWFIDNIRGAKVHRKGHVVE